MQMEEFSVESLAGSVQPQAQAQPWMAGCKFILGTSENMSEIIDQCIQSKRFGLDLETSGLDNRVINGVTVDHIAGVCIAPTTTTTYYIPLAHVSVSLDGTRTPSPVNVPWSIFAEHFKRLLAAIDAKETIAVFHNGKFDQEFLQFNGKETLGEWDRAGTWDDTMILAYLRNSRARSKGLKALAATPVDATHESPTGGPGLGMEMIELVDLWPPDYKGNLDFTTLDPSRQDVLWYAGSDALCTLRLYDVLSPSVLEPDSDGKSQRMIYVIEKACVPATRWMERNRIHVDTKTITELIGVGQKEWIDSIMEVYKEAEQLLNRDVMPGKYHILKEIFKPDDSNYPLSAQLEIAESRAKATWPDPQMKIIGAQGREWPPVYDVNSPAQLGLMFEEMGVPGLKRTEKSGQVKTSKDELDRIIDEAGASFPFMGRVKRFREVSKALTSYLMPMLTDCEPGSHLIRINFQGHKVDTGRFSTPSKDTDRNKMQGWPTVNLQGLPSTYDPKRPECMARIRECITARRLDKYLVAIDYSGVELRLVTNLSKEPLWLKEFFRCSTCGRTFDQGNGAETPPPPPSRCPNCGGDKIGDLHTLTAISIYGTDAPNLPNWKKLRGNAKCIHPDTMIIGHGTPYRIGTLPVKQDEFLTASTENSIWDGKNWQPLLETYGGGTKQLFHIITRRGVLTCSAEHRVLTAEGVLMTPSSLLKGTVLPELSTPESAASSGHWVDISHKVFEGVPKVTIQTNSHLAYLAGLTLGDGTKSVSYCAITHGDIGKTDRMGIPYSQWQDIVMDACRDAGFDPIARKGGVYLGSRHVIRFLASLQLYELSEGTKGLRRLRIPDWVWGAGKAGLYPFLGGLFDTDGTVSAVDKNLSVTTKDPIFAGHIAAALQTLGMQASVETSWNEPYQRWYFRIKIFRGDSVKFIPYMKHPGKVARLKAEGRVAKPECGRRKPNEVLLVLDAGEQECIDLHVGSDAHLYWANGFSSHNSCNFAMCYGGGGSAAQRATGVDRNEGWRIKRAFDKTYARLERWWDEQHKFAAKHAFVRTAFQRKYPLPDIHHENDFFKSKAERNAVNGPVQGCIKFDSRVLSNMGLLKIQDLYELCPSPDLKFWTGTKWVKGTVWESGEKLLCRTELSSGKFLETSPDHKFRVWNDSQLKWVPQSDLIIGQWVIVDAPKPREFPVKTYSFNVTPGTYTHNSKGFTFQGNSSFLWEFLGMVYGDGSILPGGFTIHIGGDKKFPDFSPEVHARTWAENLCNIGIEATVYQKMRQKGDTRSPIWQVKIHSKAFRVFCETILGVHSQNTYTKRFPDALWDESLENRCAFLRGYFSTDGTVSVYKKGFDSGRVSLRSTNQELLQDTQKLLYSVGLRSTYRQMSKRVDVLDRQGFRKYIGFNITYKQDRLNSIVLGDYVNQRHVLPDDIVRQVGSLVYQSSIYKGLTRPEKSAVLRLKSGSGSKDQCLQYLDRMPPSEVPGELIALLNYDYEKIIQIDRSADLASMYDVEVFDNEHAFVCDGVVVHNSSADITKIAMALIYRKCKEKGWLDKAQMVITIHDELVFEIDGDILEEAIQIFLEVMTRNEYIQAMKWPIPLTCDVEIGHSWMVPWDLNAMRFKEVRFEGNKKVKEPKEPKPDDFKDPAEYIKAVADYPGKLEAWKNLPHSWPEELRPLFKDAGGVTAPASNPEPKPESEPEPVQVREESKLEVATGYTGSPVNIPAKHTPMPEIFEFHLQEDLTSGLIDKLATVLNVCIDGGTQKLQLYDNQGQQIPIDEYFDKPVLINSVAFSTGAQIIKIRGQGTLAWKK